MGGNRRAWEGTGGHGKEQEKKQERNNKQLLALPLLSHDTHVTHSHSVYWPWASAGPPRFLCHSHLPPQWADGLP